MNTTPILPKHIWSQIPVEQLSVYTNEKPIGTARSNLIRSATAY
jgi:hypothetical protein